MPSIEERQKLLTSIANSIEEILGKVVSIDRGKERNGTLLRINIKKNGVKGLEVIVDKNGAATMVVALNSQKDKTDETKELIISIMEQSGFTLIENKKNPRFEYSLTAFLEAFEILSNHNDLQDTESRRLSKRLFKYVYSPEKIVARYIFAIKEEDQSMLDLCRDLLSADKFSSEITMPTMIRKDDRTYREHLIPCVFLHNKIIEMVLAEEESQVIAALVGQHLKIAYIKPADAYRLDYELKLRTVMPNGWEWGTPSSSIWARLDSAKIPYEK